MNARHMATAGLVAAAMILGQGAATAKTWYEKSCTSYGKDKAGNWYVGGPYNKSHLHIGSNFISVFSTNNNSKPETAGKANCTLLKAALGDVSGGGYSSAADVTACLQAACTVNGCTCP